MDGVVTERGITMSRLMIALLLSIAATSTATAQMAPKRPLEDVLAGCNARTYTPNFCDRVAAFARSRYGSNVTVVQWNSAAAAISAKMRQERRAGPR
jgi:hypothetical protein